MDSDDRSDSQPKRIIYDVQMRALASVSEYYRERIAGEVSDETRLQLASAALAFKEVLWQHRNKDALRTPWAERPIHWLDKYVDETVSIRTNPKRRSGNHQTIERPALLTIDPQRFVDVIHELEDIADELGFSASVRNRRPIYDAGKLNPEDYNEPVKDTIAKPQ